ncbi:sulfotransferase domain-containing protein [Novosphingobium album (ex Hu et al. 2023)]|uniref:Sulfotransferase n=1 Tax=Novosphingobium album (ex Hu et al. 2023) TaxID=2930093 RepID=A0ABT0B5U9_9SPHN|nr:sulfotransferase domain-containing protein [Novosphingobium album (ex Hu et al. 2023)]MCJ2180441.1 sulfotransferase [Novosphingobium album (ex Hu et al. 2023)]
MKLKLKRALRRRCPIVPFNCVGVAEFPKSGITMFTYGLSNALGELHGVTPETTWFNHNLLVRDLHIAGYFSEGKGFPLQKTHYDNDLSYNAIFVMRRNVRTLMPSWYEYSRQHFGYEGSFKRFLTSPAGVSRYERFMSSYSTKAAPWQRIVVVDYEELVRDSARVYADALRHLGYGNHDGIGDVATRASAKVARDSMVEDETFYRFNSIATSETFVKAKVRENDVYWQDVDDATLMRLHEIHDLRYKPEEPKA